MSFLSSLLHRSPADAHCASIRAAYLGAGAGLAAVSVAALTEWPLKLRVRLNSPSLWPTMFSVIYTGMNFLPLCTARVCPTISGITVDRRDHVRTTFFSLRWFMASILTCRCESMNGPFLVERPISSQSYFCLRVTMNLSVRLLLRVL